MGGDKTTTPRRTRGQVRHFMQTCLSTKLPPLPVPSELGGQQWSLKGRGGKKALGNVISTTTLPFPFGILFLWDKTIKSLSFFGACMWLNASWPTLGCIGLLQPWQCHQWLPRCGSTGFFWDVWCTPPRGSIACSGCCGGTGVGIGAEHCSAPSLVPLLGGCEALSHGTALKWLQQNTPPVPSERTLWGPG